MGEALRVDEFMTIDECAETIKISKKTLYKWSSLGVIPVRKHGTKLVFHKEEIAAWSEARRKPQKQASLSRFEAARQRLLTDSSLTTETPHEPSRRRR